MNERGSRVLIEVGVVVGLLLVFLGLWSWNGRRHERALAGQAVEQQQLVDGAIRSGEAWAQALAEHQALAVARSFAAGIHPLVATDRQQPLEAALAAMVRIPGVAFVHVLRPDGTVLGSSDDVVRTRGQVDERGAWVMGVRDIASRAGMVGGTTEVAVPIGGAEEPLAIVWLAYESDRIRSEAQPR